MCSAIVSGSPALSWCKTYLFSSMPLRSLSAWSTHYAQFLVLLTKMMLYFVTYHIYLLFFVRLRVIASPIAQYIDDLDAGEQILDPTDTGLIDLTSINAFHSSAECQSGSAENVFAEDSQANGILPRRSQGACSTNRHGSGSTKSHSPTTEIPGSEPDFQTSEPADQKAVDDPNNQCPNKNFSHLLSCVGPEIIYSGIATEVSQFFASQKFKYNGVVNCKRGKFLERYLLTPKIIQVQGPILR